MPKITFIAHSGQRHTVSAESGLSLMRAAIDHNVPGIDGDWAAKTGARTQQEDEMLNFAAELRGSSRLACQITVTDDLDGLEVTMPEGQH